MTHRTLIVNVARRQANFVKKIVFHDVQDFMLLLAGCPNLEYLRAEHIFVHCDQDSLTIQEFKSVSLPKLISADITRCWFPCFPVKALSSSEHLCVETSMLCKQDHKVYEVRFILNIMSWYLNLYDTLNRSVGIQHNTNTFDYIQ
jgi:hypothetical protein